MSEEISHDLLPGMRDAIEKLITAGVSDEFIAGTLDVHISDVKSIHDDISPRTISKEELANKVQMLLAKTLDHAFWIMEWGSAAEQHAIVRAFLVPLTRAAVGEGSDEFADIREQMQRLIQTQTAIPAKATSTNNIPTLPITLNSHAARPKTTP